MDKVLESIAAVIVEFVVVAMVLGIIAVRVGLRKHKQRKRWTEHWELIGRADYGVGKMVGVPEWVLREIRQVSWHDLANMHSESGKGAFREWKGRTYRCRFMAFGQGGTSGVVYRRLRRRWLTKSNQT